MGAGSQPIAPVNNFAVAAIPLRPLEDVVGDFVGNDDDDNNQKGPWKNFILSVATSSKTFLYAQPKRARQQPKSSRGVGLEINGPKWN